MMFNGTAKNPFRTTPNYRIPLPYPSYNEYRRTGFGINNTTYLQLPRY